MEISNVNENVRNLIVSSVEENYVQRSYKILKNIESKDRNLYKKALASLYPIFYLVNLDNELTYNINQDLFNRELGERLDEENEHDFFYDLMYLEEIKDIDDVVNLANEDSEFLYHLINNNAMFNEFTFIKKRDLLKKYASFDKELSRINKLWILDRLEYEMDINIDNFVKLCLDDKYYPNYNKSSDRARIIINGSGILSELLSYDYNCHQDLIKEIFFIAYKTQKYEENNLAFQLLLEEDIEKSIVEDPNTFAKTLYIYRDSILPFVLDSFACYYLNSEYKEKVEKFAKDEGINKILNKKLKK